MDVIEIIVIALLIWAGISAVFIAVLCIVSKICEIISEVSSYDKVEKH
jgi:hypothetical protein